MIKCLAHGALTFAFLLALGCGRRDEGTSGPPLPARGSVRGGGFGRAASPPPSTPPPAATGRDRARGDDEWRSVGRPASDEAPAPSTETPSPGTPEPAARDYASELAAAFGSPAACFDFARITTFGESLRVNVSVTVMPSGRVNRASASGTGFTPQEVACLQEHAMNVSLRGPIDGAPRTISARIEYAIEATPNETP